MRAKVRSSCRPWLEFQTIHTLSVTLATVTKLYNVSQGGEQDALGERADATHKGKGVVLEVVLQLLERPVGPLVDDLLGAGKVERLHSPALDSERSSSLGLGLERGARGSLGENGEGARGRGGGRTAASSAHRGPEGSARDGRKGHCAS